MKCQICEGKGGWREDMGEGTVLFDPCPMCKETGKIGFFQWIWNWAWNTFLCEIYS